MESKKTPIIVFLILCSVILLPFSIMFLVAIFIGIALFFDDVVVTGDTWIVQYIYIASTLIIIQLIFNVIVCSLFLKFDNNNKIMTNIFIFWNLLSIYSMPFYFLFAGFAIYFLVSKKKLFQKQDNELQQQNAYF
ncbi:hypothetical protein SCHIN_v1c01050 [Spiroplasma chinense]|uniref:Transmembrane protein n=1 Tax=Spiroplasma chinense TaxID=216932 RepID=A0A5B9Y3G6_9MOLU|nr:hypothetical protein [Spiroplasma chinense]QEH61303.1 hypothetical protein SCHIN_v1c01050 [Spiroplasma chinense]